MGHGGGRGGRGETGHGGGMGETGTHFSAAPTSSCTCRSSSAPCPSRPRSAPGPGGAAGGLGGSARRGRTIPREGARGGGMQRASPRPGFSEPQGIHTSCQFGTKLSSNKGKRRGRTEFPDA